MQYTVASFYKFIPLESHESLRAPLLTTMKRQRVLGSLILAHEGINGYVAGLPEQVTNFHSELCKYTPFSDITFSKTTSDNIPFEKAKVKLRKEIVTLGVDNADPLATPGEYVSPEEWNELISDPNVLVVDTRNDYEIAYGTFKNAVDPHTTTFKEFPDYVKKHLMENKDKKIAMFCTGGIRCEKSTAYLKALGFKNTYQLHGGILNYLREIPASKSLWQGDCFVFDNRITL